LTKDQQSKQDIFCYFCGTAGTTNETYWHGKRLCNTCTEKLDDLCMRYASEVAIG